MLSVSSLKGKLTPVCKIGEPEKRSAAVSLIWRVSDSSVLLIKRAEADEDPWAGQVALPGGLWEPGDASLVDTAVREAMEEVQLDIRRSCWILGWLEPESPRNRPDLKVYPLVCLLEEEQAEPKPGSEVSEVFWAPMPELVSSWSSELGGCFRWREKVIWGLTYRILLKFARAIGLVGS